MMRSKSAAVAAVLAAGIALGLALGQLAQSPGSASAGAEDRASRPRQSEELRQFADRLSELFRTTAEEVSPTVGWIESKRVVRVQPPVIFRDPFFERFFGPQWMEPQEQTRTGLGSGVIFDRHGYILTNYHVVKDASELQVKLADGREFEAKITGFDRDTELAVIKLAGDVDDLPVARLGDSDSLGVGDWVLAIGNPLGLAHTVSAGIVSAKGRSVGLARYEDLIQTDAAINPGNSGGPLVNMRGEVVGINTALINPTTMRTYIGIGLAIPINTAKAILEDLKAGREVKRGFLGITGDDLTPELARQFGYEGKGGAIVNEVLPDTPAEKAGLEPGDIIVRWGDEKVDSFSELRQEVAKTKPGSTVKVTVWRDGKEKTISLKVTTLPKEELLQAHSWRGITVEPLTDAVRRQYDRPELQGVLVADVAADSPAADAVKGGDVILSIARRRVGSVEEFMKVVAQVPDDARVVLRVLDSRTGHARFLVVGPER